MTARRVSPGDLLAVTPGGPLDGPGRRPAVTVLEVLPDERLRVAYGDVTDLIVPASAVTSPRSSGARSSDPGSSHLAAGRARLPERLAAGQRRALHAIVMAGRDGLNDFELADRTGSKQTSIGVRRGELAKAGLVERTGRRRPSDTLEPADVWAATDLGVAAWRELCAGEAGAA